MTKLVIISICGTFLCAGLGWKREVGEGVLNSAKLLHWNGKGIC